ncbi:MAG: magnesium-translocating P-type ATPase [Pirellulales bacterium]
MGQFTTNERAALSTSLTVGLTSVEARRRYERDGPNEPAPHRRRSLVVQLAGLFANPLVVILLVASAVSAVLHDVASAAIIGVIVLLSVALNFVQSFRSHRAAERLREQASITACVRRDGEWREVPRREVVRGDVVRLVAGDLIPADARLIEARDLHVQQSSLTGESLPVEKSLHHDASQPSSDAPLHLDDAVAVFFGSSVVSGTATAVVAAIGPATVFGDIAQRLAARPPETEFDRGTRRFSFLILQTVVVLVSFLFLASAVLHREPLQSLLFAVALAVGLTPEFLPMIVAVTLARGAERMGRKQVIVKHLAAMQNFGSIDILCSDKTGTLTEGRMELDSCVDPLGRPADSVFLLAYLNSRHESGIKSPLDDAVLRRDRPEIEGYRKIDEAPFDFERRRSSVVVEADGRRQLISKGAPEGMLDVCTTLELDGETCPLDDARRRQCLETFHRYSAQGLRTLAVATRRVPVQEAYRASDERQMTLAGFVMFADRPRAEAADAVRSLHADGVQIKILTGDNELVTQHVCRQLQLDFGEPLVGDDLDRLTDASLAHVAEQTTIFARLSPQQKNRVIAALKSRGHVVGYLGDGINDAPSLHAADVGISVHSAVEVARDAADIILVEHSLNVLHEGILEGRRAFGNVMKYLLMGTSSNFGNMFSMAIAAVFLPFLPMLPLQILLNNFLYDLAQVTIPTDHVDESFLHKPRRWDIRLIRDFMLVVGPISSLFDMLTFAVLLHGLHATERRFHTGWFLESLATQTLVLFVIRTAGNPFRSRPSRALTVAVVMVVLTGLALPWTPLAEILGFEPLPAVYFGFLITATTAYLSLVELAKRRLLKRYLD